MALHYNAADLNLFRECQIFFCAEKTPALHFLPGFSRVLLMHRDGIINVGITILHEKRKSGSGLWTRAYTKPALWKSKWRSIKIVSPLSFVFFFQPEKCKKKKWFESKLFSAAYKLCCNLLSVVRWRFKVPQPGFDWWPHAGASARSDFLLHAAGLKSDQQITFTEAQDQNKYMKLFLILWPFPSCLNELISPCCVIR